MRSRVFNVISSYTSWIIYNYQTITKSNAMSPGLRLISQQQDKKTGEINFKIQIVGKNIFPIITLKDFKNLSIFNNFNATDQDIINNYFPDKQSETKKRIIARTYDRENKRFIYTIEFFDKKSNMRRCVTMNNFSSLLVLDLNNFDSEDKRIINLELSNDLH
ncbi:MAG: hypothetical protein A3F11_08245 [Gammaproteobacteria bacterium RIFCSPHIGHO2_12_FULL_37_14]|nr:MAG: hypothetical protein A3F11_08245 [Gammaproteobacteria bacterium RIFCSPHIGHO2_12_FULL_37_14]